MREGADHVKKRTSTATVSCVAPCSNTRANIIKPKKSGKTNISTLLILFVSSDARSGVPCYHPKYSVQCLGDKQSPTQTVLVHHLKERGKLKQIKVTRQLAANLKASKHR
jgi:hypothetical protein